MTDPNGQRSIGVVGGGFMGAGIAESTARAGVDAIVVEPTEELCSRTRMRIGASLAEALQRGKLDDVQRDAACARITITTNLSDAARSDLVVEAVPESLELKREVFRKLDESCPRDTILASNTSSIPIAELASITRRRDRVLGLHFFSPVPVMKLVEVVRAIDTSSATIDAARAFCERLGKRPIETKDRSGFIVNMLLVPYLMAAVRMYEEGFASRDDIDAGMKLGCNHPMGPLQLCDFIGLDVLYSVCDSLFEEFKRDEYAPPPLIRRMIASGRLGQKSGLGFYEYGSER